MPGLSSTLALLLISKLDLRAALVFMLEAPDSYFLERMLQEGKGMGERKVSFRGGRGVDPEFVMR